MGAVHGYYEDPSSVRRIQKSFKETGATIDAIHTPDIGFRTPDSVHSLIMLDDDLFMYSLNGILRPNSAGMFMKVSIPNDRSWITCGVLSNGDFIVGGSSNNYWLRVITKAGALVRSFAPMGYNSDRGELPTLQRMLVLPNDHVLVIINGTEMLEYNAMDGAFVGRYSADRRRRSFIAGGWSKLRQQFYIAFVETTLPSEDGSGLFACSITALDLTARAFSSENVASFNRVTHAPSDMLFDSKDNCLMFFPCTSSMRVFNPKWELIASFKISPTLGGFAATPAQPTVLLTKVRRARVPD